MDALAALALFDPLEADREPLDRDDLSEFDDLGSSNKDGLSSGEEELLDSDILGGGNSTDEDSVDDAHASDSQSSQSTTLTSQTTTELSVDVADIVIVDDGDDREKT